LKKPRFLRKILDPSFFAAEGIPSQPIRSVSFTGVHGQLLADVLSAPYEVETIAQVLG